VKRYMSALSSAGYECRCVTSSSDETELSALDSANILTLSRISWQPLVKRAVARARSAGAAVIFDIDDLMFDPTFARADVIDGIRQMNIPEETVKSFFHDLRKCLLAADFCTAPTEYLRSRMESKRRPAFVLPNGFDEVTFEN